MIWNKARECMSRDEMTAFQNQALMDLVDRVYHNVPFYRAKMQGVGLEPADIKGISDLHLLPFTTKNDLRDNYPFGLFAVPMSQIIRLHASSGTTGKSIVVGYTRKDLNIWSEVVARTMYFAGIGNKDIVQIAYGYGLFTGGLGIHYGSEKIGAVAIPVSGGNTKRQLQIMEDFGSTALACTPSYAMFLAEALEESDIRPENLKLRVGIFGAEPWTENMRKQIEEKLKIKAIDIYGLSEVIGPGVACECEMQDGLHINEDHFIPEIIDPDTLKVLPGKTKGELVFTTVSKEGLPLIRYRTRDLTALNYTVCECGRTLVKMDKCTGRSDDMLIIRGVNLFPSQIESVLLEISETRPYYRIVVDRINKLDTLQVEVEVEGKYFLDRISQLQSLRDKIQSALESSLGLSVEVRLVEPKTIARSEGKSVRVIDKRKII